MKYQELLRQPFGRIQNAYNAFRAYPGSAKLAIGAALIVGFCFHFALTIVASPHESTAIIAGVPSDVSPVVIGLAQSREIKNSFSGHATLQAWKEITLHPDQQVTIREVSVRVGQHVEKGQALAMVDSEVQSLRSELQQIDLRLRESDYRVTMALAKKDFISRNEQNQKVLEHRAQELRTKIATIESSGRLLSPISGVVSEVQLKAGDYIDNSMNYFIKIVDPSQLKVSLYLPHTAAQKLANDGQVDLIRNEAGDDGQDHEVITTGKIVAIAPVVDSKTGSVLVEVVVSAFPPSWKPGLSVEASLALDHLATALVVPSGALVYQKGQAYVFRLKSTEAREPSSSPGKNSDEPPRVERVAVKTGLRDASSVQIVEGLAENDSIVVEGQGSLADGAKVEVVR